jgi:hypothetical protein
VIRIPRGSISQNFVSGENFPINFHHQILHNFSPQNNIGICRFIRLLLRLMFYFKMF